MIKKVNGIKIGDTFEFEGDEFEVTGFKSRYTIFGKIKDYKPGSPNTCKVSIKNIVMKNKEISTEYKLLVADPFFLI